MGGRAVAMGLVLAATACRGPVRAVEVPNGDAFYAVLDDGGAIVEVGRLAADRSSTGIELGASLWVWTFPPNTILDEGGRPLDESALREVELTTELRCGRCRVPADGLPQILMAGDDCPIPGDVPVSGVRSNGERIESDPPRLFLSRSGDCPEAPERIESGTAVDVCPLWPKSGPLLGERHALNDDGRVMGAASNFVFTASDRDTGFVRTLAPHRLIRGAGPLPASDGFMFSARRVTKADARLDHFRVSADRTITQIDSIPDNVETARVVRFPMEPDVVYLIGRVGQVSGILRCEVVNGVPTNCAREQVDPGCVNSEDIFDASGLSSGAAIATQFGGGLLTRGSVGGRWQCLTIADTTFTDPGGTRIQFDRVFRTAAIGERWFACGSSPDAGGVLTGTVSADGRPAGVRVARAEAGGCGSLAILPDRPNQVVAHLGNQRFVFDATGDVVESCVDPTECAALGLRPPVPIDLSLVLWADGVAAWLSPRGPIYTKRTGEPFQQVFGSEDPADAERAIAVPFDDETAMVFMGARAPIAVQRTSADCDGFTSAVVADPYPVGESHLPEVAVRLADSVVLVAGRENVPFIRRVSGRPIAVTHRELSEDQQITALAALDATRAIALSDSEIWLVDESLELIRVPVVWDDPLTTEVEASPVEDILWRAVDAKDGVAWVVGGRQIARVRWDGQGRLRAEGYWSHRLASEQTAFFDFRALHVFSADRLVTAAFDELSTGRTVIVPWRIGPRGLDCPEVGGQSELVACVFEGFDLLSNASPENNDRPEWILGTEGRLTWLFSGSGSIYRFGGTHTTVPFRQFQSAAEMNGWFVFGGHGLFAAGNEVGP